MQIYTYAVACDNAKKNPDKSGTSETAARTTGGAQAHPLCSFASQHNMEHS